MNDHDEGDREADGPFGVELGQRKKSQNLYSKASIERRGQAEAGGDPAGGEVGDHAGDLVKDEEIRQLDGGKAERVEMQQHQHPQRAVGEHECPVGRCDGDIGREALGTFAGLAHSEAPTIRATSTRR